MRPDKNLRDLAERSKGGDAEASHLLIMAIPSGSPLADLEPEEIVERLLGEPEEEDTTDPSSEKDEDTTDPASEGKEGEEMLADACPTGMDIEDFKAALRAAEDKGIITCKPEIGAALGYNAEE